MNKNAVGWFEIYVNDIARARDFYESVFGVRLERLGGEDPGFEMWGFPGVDGGTGCPGALVYMAGVQAGGNSTLVYFNCDDCAVEAGRALGAGGSIFKPKFAIGEHGFVALAVDPDGNMFGLHSMV
jgi:predicted enzyme related to lactoylglutathione lyase